MFLNIDEESNKQQYISKRLLRVVLNRSAFKKRKINQR